MGDEGAMVLRDRRPERGGVIGNDRVLWARGYCVSIVGLNEEVIRRYVAEVPTHSFREVLVGCQVHRGFSCNWWLEHYVSS